MVNPFKQSLAFLGVLFLSSCCKPIFEVETLFNNTYEERIELRFYENGRARMIGIGARSTVSASFMFPNIKLLEDSIEVVANDKIMQTHYNAHIKLAPSGPHIYSYDSPKNLFNMNSYKVTNEQFSCGGSSTKYQYTFN